MPQHAVGIMSPLAPSQMIRLSFSPQDAIVMITPRHRRVAWAGTRGRATEWLVVYPARNASDAIGPTTRGFAPDPRRSAMPDAVRTQRHCVSRP